MELSMTLLTQSITGAIYRTNSQMSLFLMVYNCDPIILAFDHTVPSLCVVVVP